MNENGTCTRTAVELPADRDTVTPRAGEGFVVTDAVREVTDRALTYLRAGYPVHFCGPAGTGKTTLALHIAAGLGRPVTLVHGDDQFGSSDLVGDDQGYRRSKVVDNFIHSVMKTEEEMRTYWAENRLTTACRQGHTLVYDEFSRSRPEANNVLLSILGEGLLNLPKLRERGEGYLKVHPEFHAIFTSNPEEYAGVHRTQDALLDRLITLHVDHYDRETEVEITRARSGVARRDAERIVDVVRTVRDLGVRNHRPTIRACIAIGRILSYRKVKARPEEPVFRWACLDVLGTNTAKVTRGDESIMPGQVEQAMLRLFDEMRPAPKTTARTMRRIERREACAQ